MAPATKAIDFHPPKAVQKALERGLALKDEYGGKGLQAGTVRWAEHLGAGKPSEPAQALRMRAWFHRHKVDKKKGWDSPPTPGYVAWLLWGGDAGEKWAEKLAEQVEQRGKGHDEPAKKAADGPRGGAKKGAAPKSKKLAQKKSKATGSNTTSKKADKKVSKKAGKKVSKKAGTKVSKKVGKKAGK